MNCDPRFPFAPQAVGSETQHSRPARPPTFSERSRVNDDSEQRGILTCSHLALDRVDSPPLADNSIDLQLPVNRVDSRADGAVDSETPKGTTLGPRQRRFEFDAKVIRDTIVRKLRLVGRNDLADPIDDCHRDAVYKRCCGCRHVKTFYNRCERFYCPICAARLARDRRETVEWWSHVVNQPKHIVLTVKSVPVLNKAYIRQLKDDFRKLRKQKWAMDGEFMWRATAIRPCVPTDEPMPGRRRRRGRLSPWRGTPLGHKSTKWRGGFWSIDATWHRDIQPGETYRSNGDTLTAETPIARGWHIHLHIIADADFIDRDKLELEWSRLRGQRMSIVRVYNVRGQDYIAEACKYVTDGVQLGNWPADKLAEFGDALSEERCFDTFGALYKQRAEWTAAKAEIHSDRSECECGSKSWEIFNSNEWEWQQLKSSLSPPPQLNRPQAVRDAQLSLLTPAIAGTSQLAYGVR